MHIAAHTEIVNEVLKLINIFENDIFAHLQLVPKHMSEARFIDGLQYPDFICGEYKIENNKISNDTHVCKGLDLLEFKTVDHDENAISILSQSHRGRYAYDHATTPDSSFQVYQVKAFMLMRCLKLYYAAIVNQDVLHFGRLIHMVHDSYSPSHTKRNLPQDLKTDLSKLSTTNQTSDVSESGELNKNVMAFLNQLYLLTDQDIDQIINNSGQAELDNRNRDPVVIEILKILQEIKLIRSFNDPTRQQKTQFMRRMLDITKLNLNNLDKLVKFKKIAKKLTGLIASNDVKTKLLSLILNELNIYNNIKTIQNTINTVSTNSLGNTGNSSNTIAENSHLYKYVCKLVPSVFKDSDRHKQTNENMKAICTYVNQQKTVDPTIIQVLLNTHNYKQNYKSISHINQLIGKQDRHLKYDYQTKTMSFSSNVDHTYRPIQNFQSMFNQSGKFHPKHDTNPCLKKFGVYNYVCEDTYLLFLLFAKHMNFYYGQTSPDQNAKIKTILNELLYYLNNSIFIIDGTCIAKLTNEKLDYQDEGRYLCNDNVDIKDQLTLNQLNRTLGQIKRSATQLPSQSIKQFKRSLTSNQ